MVIIKPTCDVTWRTSPSACQFREADEELFYSWQSAFPPATWDEWTQNNWWLKRVQTIFCTPAPGPGHVNDRRGAVELLSYLHGDPSWWDRIGVYARKGRGRVTRAVLVEPALGSILHGNLVESNLKAIVFFLNSTTHTSRDSRVCILARIFRYASHIYWLI